MATRPLDIAIVGCGVAGMTAAIFLQRSGFRPASSSVSPRRARSVRGCCYNPPGWRFWSGWGYVNESRRPAPASIAWTVASCRRSGELAGLKTGLFTDIG